MVKFKNVSKTYRNSIHALNDVNLFVDDGEFVFITGASGSGKSTLLKLLTKEEEMTSGEIEIFGKRISTMKRREIPYYRRRLGIIFQDFRIIENMTVYQNIEFALRISSISPKLMKKRIFYVLGLLSIENKAKCYPRELSGGEKQRVGIARAIVNNPKLIIADEPTGNIDPSMSYEIIELLSQINKKGTTVMVVTHDISVVEKFNFKVVELQEGKVSSVHNGLEPDLVLA